MCDEEQEISFYPGLLADGVLALSACTQEERTLTVLTHDSFAISEDVVAQFEQENNVKVNFILSGDTGGALNKVILTKDAPLGDVFYGVDNTFLSRALDEDIYEAYHSPLLADIPDEFKLDGQDRALPVDYGDVCINYDKTYFAAKQLAIPQSLDALLDPQYAGLWWWRILPFISGMAFLLATIAQYGEDDYLNYWQQLKDNGLVVVNDWETAYYSNFSGSSGKVRSPWWYLMPPVRQPK
jgi:thiamine transport system substrate-binding protein